MAFPLAHDVTAREQELSALLEIDHALTSTANLRSALRRVLEILERQVAVSHGTVTLLTQDNGPLHIDALHGGSGESGPARRRLGDELQRHVVDSGKPVVVPRVSREPMLANRIAGLNLDKRDLTLIAVPIVLNGKPAGALTVELPHQPERDYDGQLRFLRVAASMVAQAVKVNRLIDTERERLLEENIHLREELRERYDFSHIIGSSRPVRQVYEQITQVARTNTTVLIRGESGTGKELIAHAPRVVLAAGRHARQLARRRAAGRHASRCAAGRLHAGRRPDRRLPDQERRQRDPGPELDLHPSGMPHQLRPRVEADPLPLPRRRVRRAGT